MIILTNKMLCFFQLLSSTTYALVFLFTNYECIRFILNVFDIVNIIRVFTIINLFGFGLIVIVLGIYLTRPNKGINICIAKFSEASLILV